jgi:hypothetical protein
MKSVVLILICWGLSSLSALAQNQSMQIDESQGQQSRDVQRQRIKAERKMLEDDFGQESAACNQTFFVNNCLDEIKVRRRESLADLRRQEVSLNEQERRLKAAEQVQKADDKVRPEKLREESEKRLANLKDIQSRQQRDREKQALRLKPDAAHSKAESDSLGFKRNEDKASARSDRQASSIDEAKKFAERQAKAKERQLKHQQEQENRTKSPSNPLPVPQ